MTYSTLDAYSPADKTLTISRAVLVKEIALQYELDNLAGAKALMYLAQIMGAGITNTEIRNARVLVRQGLDKHMMYCNGR